MQSNIPPAPPTPICDLLIENMRKVLHQYDEGAVLVTEAVANVFNSMAEKSDELQQECEAVETWSEKVYEEK